MTKEQFKKLALDAVETILTMPDDLWATGYPLLRLKYKGSDEIVVVGIAETDSEHDGDNEVDE